MMHMTNQLTLQGLLDALASVEQNATLMLAGFGSGSYPGTLFRHRPFVDGLAITPSANRARSMSAAQYAEHLRVFGLGRRLEIMGHRPFEDQHPAGPNTPMWVSTSHDLSFNAITGVEMMKGFAVIRSVNLAPVQGPPIQRIPDGEVEARMQKVDELLRGEANAHSPKVVKWLINMAARDRTIVRLDLEEARRDLDNFEASLQAKRDRVAKLEADAARNDYLLGITDDLPENLKVNEPR